MKGPLFYSKILLFGEYGIIKDSKGLSIPYNSYNGALKYSKIHTPHSKKSNNKLKDYFSYLFNLNKELVVFNVKKMTNDLSRGLYFDSSIPMGYGVGSSGALVAAVYDSYAKEKITVLENLTRDKLIKLKLIFAEMESFFHGKSSGLDPLNSYLSLPILISSKNEIEATGIPSQNLQGTGAVFLLDSGKVGETAPMVQIFMDKMKEEGFRKMLYGQFIKYSDSCVDNFLNGDIKSLFKNTKQLSKVVLNNFKPMIPKKFHELWASGIESNAYYLKLCGSGGGGYILGFTENLERAKKALSGFKLEIVYTF